MVEHPKRKKRAREAMGRASEFMTQFEARPASMTLYFGSATQRLSSPLIPHLPQTAHSDYTKEHPSLYATNDKAYASVFTFPWTEEEGFEFGKSGKTGHYILKIPYRLLSRLEQPCSLYSVHGLFSRLPLSTPEYVTHDPVDILHEERYKTVSDCLKSTGVRVHVVQVSPRLRGMLEPGVREKIVTIHALPTLNLQ